MISGISHCFLFLPEVTFHRKSGLYALWEEPDKPFPIHIALSSDTLVVLVPSANFY
jgi:hypothetical protein